MGVPTSREGGGGKPVGPKDQVCQRKYFWGSPKQTDWSAMPHKQFTNQGIRLDPENLHDQKGSSKLSWFFVFLADFEVDLYDHDGGGDVIVGGGEGKALRL